MIMTYSPLRWVGVVILWLKISSGALIEENQVLYMGTDKLIVGERYHLSFTYQAYGDVSVSCGTEKEELKAGVHLFERDFTATRSDWTVEEDIVVGSGGEVYADAITLTPV